MPVDRDEREQCSVPDCATGVWFTAEQLCRVHGIEAGADQPKREPEVGVEPEAPVAEQKSKKATAAQEGDT